MAWKMAGDYLKNCNCAATCSCDTTGFPSPHKNCEGFLAMRIQDGHREGLSLSGVTWAANYHWPGALHEGNGTAEIFIDKSASPEQQEALMKILSGQEGGALFEIFSQIVTTFHGPNLVDIEFEFDREARRAKVKIPGVVETETKPLTVPATGDEQRVIVKLPGGFEYKEMEVAQTTKLRSTGQIKYEHSGTHSSLAHVVHTDQGLIA